MSDPLKIDAATYKAAFGVQPSRTAATGVQDALDGREVYSEEGVVAVALVIVNELNEALRLHEAAAESFAKEAGIVPAVMDGVEGHIELRIPVPSGPEDVPIQPITLRTCRLARSIINRLRDVVGNHPGAHDHVEPDPAESLPDPSVPSLPGV